jgi:hypothetical protein
MRITLFFVYAGVCLLYAEPAARATYSDCDVAHPLVKEYCGAIYQRENNAERNQRAKNCAAEKINSVRGKLDTEMYGCMKRAGFPSVIVEAGFQVTAVKACMAIAANRALSALEKACGQSNR